MSKDITPSTFDERLDCIMGWCFHGAGDTCPIFKKFLTREDGELTENWKAQKQAIKQLVAREAIGQDEFPNPDKGFKYYTTRNELRHEQLEALGIQDTNINPTNGDLVRSAR